MGGGFGIAAACDLRIADGQATFAIPAAKLGVGYPPAAMAYVVAAVGPQLAFDLFYTARRLTADEAKERGFVSRLFATESFEGARACARRNHRRRRASDIARRQGGDPRRRTPARRVVA